MSAFTKAILKAKMAKSTNDAKVDAPNQKQPIERILTVNIKTMRIHIRNDDFNNVNTLLEVFAKVHRVADGEDRTKIRLALRDFNSAHTMEAVFFGGRHRIQAGDVIRCVGHLIGRTGQFKILKMFRINLEDEMALINRLEAISSFELTKSPPKVRK